MSGAMQVQNSTFDHIHAYRTQKVRREKRQNVYSHEYYNDHEKILLNENNKHTSVLLGMVCSCSILEMSIITSKGPSFL